MLRPYVVCAAAIEGGSLADAVVGVGKSAAAMRMTEVLLRRPVEWVLLIGVCGAYRGSGLDVGGLCVVGEDVLADEGVAVPSGGFFGLDELGLGSNGPFLSDPQRSAQVAQTLAIPIVRGATVSTCSGEDALASVVAARSQAQVETMEGAAVVQACSHLQVPVVQLRCVSNHCGDRQHGGWDLAGAVSRLHAAVEQLAQTWEHLS